jgi:4-hydroxy-2-oxoheptanedioate aldolase
VLEIGSPAYVQSTADAVVILMIEKKEAIENLEQILAVPGVDMVQFGQTDYAMSLGVTGNRQHPAVEEARWYLVDTALKMGVTPRAEVGSPEAALPYWERGVRHFCMGTDTRILYNWYVQNGGKMRQFFDTHQGQ